MYIYACYFLTMLSRVLHRTNGSKESFSPIFLHTTLGLLVAKNNKPMYGYWADWDSHIRIRERILTDLNPFPDMM